jgi:hypothetical protein
MLRWEEAKKLLISAPGSMSNLLNHSTRKRTRKRSPKEKRPKMLRKLKKLKSKSKISYVS